MKAILKVGCVLLLALPGCGGAAPVAAPDEAAPVTTPGGVGVAPDGDAKQAAIVGFAFEPNVLRVDVGDTVRWTNEDDIAHTVTSGRPKKQGVPGVSEDRAARPDGTFDSGTLELDDTFEFVARSAGTYRYFCAIHAGMEARLIVR